MSLVSFAVVWASFKFHQRKIGYFIAAFISMVGVLVQLFLAPVTTILTIMSVYVCLFIAVIYFYVLKSSQEPSG
ncbi:hypothetical protein DL93DRAFT_1672305 [Clavulina sp. PMI_390]|nr:hypothetical protein DL93DRAFT_1672305 [Clavulina sp. PMI_390]